MRVRFYKFLILCVLMCSTLVVSAEIKCAAGKPGDTVSCSVTKTNEHSGTISRIKVDQGLTFDSCDVCSEGSYVIAANTAATFKFKVDSTIKESKTLNVTFAGESGSIKVEVEESENDTEKTYTVTLIPGNNRANITKSCTVNSLNTTCNVMLDDIDDTNFAGWGTSKDCNAGSKGSIKVNKDITYYACYKNDTKEETGTNTNVNNNLLLKSLIVKNGEEEISLDFSIRIKEYNITIPTNVESLDVEALAQDENVKVVITGNDNLDKEENKISVLLTDKDDKTNEYIINVTKSDKVELPLLSNLIIGGYTIDFKPETFIYNVSIDDGITELNIDPTVADESLDVEIIGNKDIKNSSQISIVVTDIANDASSTYVIKIEKAMSNLIIYIGIGAVLLIVLIILLIVVVKKGKKKNNKNEKPSTDKKPGKVVNNKSNIPEVKPTIPVAPVNEVKPVNKDTEKSEEIEVLDF